MDPSILQTKYWERVAWTFVVILAILFLSNIRM